MAFQFRERLRTFLDDIARGDISLTVDYLRLADGPTPASCRGDADCRCTDAVSRD